MKIDDLIIIEMNDEIIQAMILSFLTGYRKKCSYDLLLTSIAMIYNSNIRTLLSNANKKSTIDSLFQKKESRKNKIDLINIADRIKIIRDSFNNAVIKLFSYNYISISDNIGSSTNFDYHSCNFPIIREYLKASYYLGLILSKENTEEFLTYIF